ncbi:MAG TPA: protease complex subunit PrcB family protein [Gemmatimonadota bacterium]|nr:protease complex subunit PrcB family protein [Gemmatimonadota bacterium]
MRVIPRFLLFAILLSATLLPAAGASAQIPYGEEPAERPPAAEEVPDPEAMPEPVPAVEPEVAAEPEPLPVTGIVDQIFTGFGGSMRTLIRTEAEWNGFWRQAQGGRDPIPPAPEIDFGTQMVVAAALGARPTEGYSIDIASVQASEEGIHVEVVEISPGEGCLINRTETTPVKAVAVPKRPGLVTFSEQSTVRECG